MNSPASEVLTFDESMALWRWAWETGWPMHRSRPLPPQDDSARGYVAVLSDAACLAGDSLLGAGLAWLGGCGGGR